MFMICCRAVFANQQRLEQGEQPSSRGQDGSLTPIWTVLVDATLVIWPKLGAETFRTGLLYCGQLKTLNDSKRTWSRIWPDKVKAFATVRSTRRRPGPCT